MIAVQSSDAPRLADAETLPVAATIWSAVSSFPAGAWRSAYPVPAVHDWALADDPMPKSSSLAAVVVTLPLVGAVPFPCALVVWSRGATVFKPLYSWVATRRVAGVNARALHKGDRRRGRGRLDRVGGGGHRAVRETAGGGDGLDRRGRRDRDRAGVGGRRGRRGRRAPVGGVVDRGPAGGVVDPYGLRSGIRPARRAKGGLGSRRGGGTGGPRLKCDDDRGPVVGRAEARGRR